MIYGIFVVGDGDWWIRSVSSSGIIRRAGDGRFSWVFFPQSTVRDSNGIWMCPCEMEGYPQFSSILVVFFPGTKPSSFGRLSNLWKPSLTCSFYWEFTLWKLCIMDMSGRAMDSMDNSGIIINGIWLMRRTYMEFWNCGIVVDIFSWDFWDHFARTTLM